MSIKSQELKRAEFAYDWITKNVKKTEDDPKSEKYQREVKIEKNFKSYAKNIPAYIKTNGIAATYAFVGTKKGTCNEKEKAWDKIYEITELWLKKDECAIKKKLEWNDNEDLKAKLISIDSQNYKLATKEILALFSWIRRFAVSELEGE